MSPRSIVAVLALGLVSSLAAGRPGLAAEKYTADPVHSTLVFRVKHVNTTDFWGRFNTIAGSFTLDEANPAGCQFEFTVKADSVDTGNGARDKHLKGPDFFNAVQFPEISFKSQSIKQSGNGYEVTGDLTLHGVTKPTTIRIVPTGKGEMRGKAIAGIAVTFQIKQSDFGMTKNVGPLGDEVLIHAGIEGQKN
jgi:polyisoprenoid-binding protein YceI